MNNVLNKIDVESLSSKSIKDSKKDNQNIYHVVDIYNCYNSTYRLQYA